jgi:hypothetical protein
MKHTNTRTCTQMHVMHIRGGRISRQPASQPASQPANQLNIVHQETGVPECKDVDFEITILATSKEEPPQPGSYKPMSHDADRFGFLLAWAKASLLYKMGNNLTPKLFQVMPKGMTEVLRYIGATW